MNDPFNIIACMIFNSIFFSYKMSYLTFNCLFIMKKIKNNGYRKVISYNVLDVDVQDAPFFTAVWGNVIVYIILSFIMGAVIIHAV